MSQTPLAALRPFVRPRPAAERCDHCGNALPSTHQHQFHPEARKLFCACATCALLYQAVYRDVPQRVRILEQFEIPDREWNSLLLPISLVFLSFSTPTQRMIALYPGAAGVTESALDLDSWESIASLHPALREMQPDVEALLVNRIGTAREYFVVPVDECYKLAGVIRLHWRGLSGGAAVWGEVARFFADLRRRGLPCPA